MLDRGNQADWFESTSICVMTFIAVSAFLGFLLHNYQNTTKMVFDLSIFKDWNFTMACILLCIFGLGLYGVLVVQPMMMESLLDYPALTTGFMMAPRGISGMISMMIVAQLIKRVDPRLLIVAGILISVLGMYVGTYYSLNYLSPFWLLFPMVLQGFGLGMVFVPLGFLAYSTLDMSKRTEAAGLYSLLRTIGSSIGISIAITIYTRDSQVFWNQLGGFLTPFNVALRQFLAPLNLHPTQTLGAAILHQQLYQQAAMLAFINVFAFIMWCFLCMLPLVLLLKKPRAGTKLEIME